MKERVGAGSSDLQERFYTRYKAFLESELEKIERQDQGEVDASEEDKFSSP